MWRLIMGWVLEAAITTPTDGQFWEDNLHLTTLMAEEERAGRCLQKRLGLYLPLSSSHRNPTPDFLPEFSLPFVVSVAGFPRSVL